jgi:NTP pyrophosphatase (non-canonical NTP hydrolase)
MTDRRSGSQRLELFQQRLRVFRDERDWKQFHTPKELAAAISIEAAELQELFLWREDPRGAELDPERKRRLREELADLFIHCLNLADSAEIDILDAIDEKLRINELKYPVEKAKGSAKKYDELE